MGIEKEIFKKLSETEEGYKIKRCFGLNGCPNAITNSENLLKDLERILKEEKITEFLKEKVKGKLKIHHKFKVGLSECPNACSQIYICDFALHGVVEPEVNVKKCSFCGSCVEVCEEEAITLTDYGPVIDEKKCVGCGACIRICPEQLLKEHFKGYKIYIGGKLGRHPRLATFLSYANENEVIEIFKKVLNFYKKHNVKGERLGAIIERIGFLDANSLFLQSL